jgi:hypothetical protein
MGEYRTSEGHLKIYTTKSAVIANGASLSGVIDLEQLNITGLLIPAAWTAADITFQVSPDGTTFGDLVDSSGNEVKLSGIAAGKFIGVNLAEASGVRYLKIRSGTSAAAVNQAAERTISLIVTNNPEASAGSSGSGGTISNLPQSVPINASVTRPADTNAYAAGDAVTDSTSAPTVITFTNAAKQNNGGGTIVSAELIDSANQSTKAVFELWLFDTTVTPDNDNAACTPTDAELATLVGIIPFDVSYVGDAQSGASGNAVYQAQHLNLPFKAGASSRNLFGLLVVRNAYTPVSAEVFTIRLNVAQE